VHPEVGNTIPSIADGQGQAPQVLQAHLEMVSGANLFGKAGLLGENPWVMFCPFVGGTSKDPYGTLPLFMGK
jgi:hypothetical protein